MGFGEKIIDQMIDAEKKAWAHLSNGTYSVFGYHASRWINYKRLLDEDIDDPWQELIDLAKSKGHTVKKVDR